MRKLLVMSSIGLAMALQIVGCGSGSTVTLPQQKNARLIFSVSTSASLPVPVRTLTLVARVPAGVTVPVTADGTPVFSTTKSGITGGSYIAPLLTLTLADPSTPSGLSSDNNVRTFAEIIVSYPANAAIDETSFMSVNNPPASFSAFGLDNSTTVNLTGYLKQPTLRVTF